MRTAIIIALGFALWGVCLAADRIWHLLSPSAATRVFLAVWLLAAGANLWIGVTRAGYSFRDELPIFLLIFALPAAVAIFVKWKFWSA